MRHLFAALLLFANALSALALPYSNVYVFGDSLSDVGNVQNVYGGLPHPPPAPAVIPGAPYDSAGRASNGPIYVDALAQGLGFSATPSTTGGNVYAYGGARTRYQTMGPSFLGILDQIAQFRANPGDADANALYVVWGGANNLQDIITGKTTDALGNPVPNLAETVADIASGILGLYDEGARRFLIPNAPDLALTPRISEYGLPAQAGAHMLSLAFNAALSGVLQQLDAAHTDLDIVAFDTYALLNDVIGNPAARGITNTTERCYTGDDLGFSGGGSVCANPDSYLFWDGIHPTSHTHGILGQAMLETLGVPEPGSLPLIAVAIMAIGALRLRRQPGRA